MNSRENFRKTINHEQPDNLVVDFGATPVSGIHVLMVEKLRAHFGLEKKHIKVVEPYQMLGEIDDELMQALGVDVIGLSPRNNMFGHLQEHWKSYKTLWGQEVLVPGKFNTSIDEKGDVLMYPEGDTSVAPSAKMSTDAFFFDALNRQEVMDESKMNPEDNLEEFSQLTSEDLNYWKQEALEASEKGKAVIINPGGMAIGDIALVPAMNLKHPKGIRDVSEWYMSTIMRPDYLHQVFEKQTDIAIENLKILHKDLDDLVDAIFICGTDFGTQNSSFCSVETYQELYMPYYKKMNNWIHHHTQWKTFKHCCGSVYTFMQSFIDSGFDIINPVQLNARGMDPVRLKEEFGDSLVFWGGGADTQMILPFGDTAEVKNHVKRNCEVLAKDGGFVFNTVHNIQANVPVANVIAMFEALNEF